MLAQLIIGAWVILAVTPGTSGSLGDRLVTFRDCLHNCTHNTCHNVTAHARLGPITVTPGTSGSLGDRLVTFRDCLHNCTHNTCHNATAHARLGPVTLTPGTSGSLGDRLVTFRDCLHNCTHNTCHNATAHARFLEAQPMGLRLLGWHCEEECDYDCMWTTLSWLRHVNYTEIPQFHGKWPFVRVLGIQEPASVLFSLTNLAAFVYFHSAVSALPSEAPMRRPWLSYARLAILVWVASTVFHTRDTPLTEAGDYLSAFAAILFGAYVSILRIFGREAGRRAGRILLLYYAAHVAYLTLYKFDYGYNMAANVVAGLLSTGLWLWWMRGEDWERVRWGVAMLVLATASLSLELLDFPPFGFVLDAHALWHAATTPLPLLWTKFVVADCLYLLHNQRYKAS